MYKLIDKSVTSSNKVWSFKNTTMYKISNILVLAVIFAFNFAGVNADGESYIYLPGKKLDQDPNYQRIGRVDPNYENYRRLDFVEATSLSLCDDNRELCLSMEYNSNDMEFKTYNPDSNWDSYLSATRCAKGVVASNKSSPNGNVYKYCADYKDDNAQKATFQLPPQLCQETCEDDEECVGYAVDTPGQNCITYKAQSNDYSSYVYMPPSNIVTRPYPSIQKMKAFALLNSTSDSNCNSCMSFGSCSSSTIKTSCGTYTCCDDGQTMCLPGKCP